MSTAANFAAEAAALRNGSGLVDRTAFDRLVLRGADRRRFLHGLVTCEVKGLADGAAVYGFFTDRQGKVLAETTIAALADRLLLELPPGRGAAIAEHLRRFLVADRVEIEAPALAAAALVGPLAPERAPGEAAALAPGAVVELAGTPGVVAIRREIVGLPAVELVGEEAALAPLLEGLRAAPGVVPVSEAALERVRVLAGIPRFGPDFGPDTLPQETGREEAAVSYTKGCYLGQEIVARIHYRGGVQRGFRGLRIAGALPPAGTPVFFEGREAGRVGSGVADGGEGFALALLHQRVPTGAAVRLGEGDHSPEATVVALPSSG